MVVICVVTIKSQSSINNKLIDQQHELPLRATPHALTLPAPKDKSMARVWYGLMVLPPKDASIPDLGSTFGEARKFVVDSTTAGEIIPLGIGCSSPNMKVVINSARSRSLEETQCAEDELFCWFRCQRLIDFGLTTETCSERNLQLKCANPRGQVLPDGKAHGDYFPSCTNSTEPVTPYPQIAQQDNVTCTDEFWAEFKGRGDYDHIVKLNKDPMGDETYLSWSVVEGDDGKRKIKARLAFNNVFGYLSMGFANKLDQIHNGMNGGTVLLAIPGGNYSAVTGLDLTVGGSVGTYVIDSEDTAFRHWDRPIETDEALATMADYEHDDCFTALMFETDHINDEMFDIDGSDDLIWAANKDDYFVGYHGPFNRARFTVEWKTGNISFFGEKDEDGHDGNSHEDGDGHNHSTPVDVKSAGTRFSTSVAFGTFLALAATFMIMISIT